MAWGSKGVCPLELFRGSQYGSRYLCTDRDSVRYLIVLHLAGYPSRILVWNSIHHDHGKIPEYRTISCRRLEGVSALFLGLCRSFTSGVQKSTGSLSALYISTLSVGMNLRGIAEDIAT